MKTKQKTSGLFFKDDGYSFIVTRSSKLTGISYQNRYSSSSRLRAHLLNGRNNLHPLGDAPKNDVFSVQPVSLGGAEEELRPIGVGSRVGHGKDPRSGMLELKILVGELLTVDGLSASAVAACEVTSLAHETWNHAVED